MMEYEDFYYCTQLFLERMGYMSHIVNDNIHAETEDEKKIRKWFKWGLTAVEFFFDVDIPISSKPILISLDKLTQEELTSLRDDWETFRKDFPVAGLHFSQGQPCVFCAKIADFQFSSIESLEQYYNSLHKAFLTFSPQHRIAISNTVQSRLILCLGYTDTESADIGKKFLKQSGSKLHLFRQIFIETWIFDMDSYHIITPNGVFNFFSSFKCTMERGTKKVKEFIGESPITTLKEWPFKNTPMIMISSFEKFAELYAYDVKNGNLSIPKEWLEYLKNELFKLKKLSYEALLCQKKREIEKHEILLGEEIFYKHRYNNVFKPFEKYLNEISFIFQAINENKEKIQTVLSLREQWDSIEQNKIDLENNQNEAEQQFKEKCCYLAESIFKNEYNRILEDSVLNSIFSCPLQLQRDIEQLESEIDSVEKSKAGFFDRVKKSTRILYLKGMIRKNKSRQKGNWYDVGKRVVDLNLYYSPSSKIKPTWDTLIELMQRLHQFQIQIKHAIDQKLTITNKINQIASNNSLEHYPWLTLENSFNDSIQSLEEKLPQIFFSIGNEYRRTKLCGHIPTLNMEIAISELERQQTEIIKELKILYEQTFIELHPKIDIPKDNPGIKKNYN